MSILKSYNIGVIGAGWIAKAHMGFLQETGRANITWIAARNPENLEKVRSEFDIPNKTHDYRNILKDPAVEVEEMMMLKAQYPELMAMECSARHSRLNPKFTLVKELIDSGALGEIYHIHHQSVDRQNRPGIEFHPIAKWFLDISRAGGGPLFDWGVYDLSFHLGILGDEQELERVESVVLKTGLDDVDPETAKKHMDIIFSINELNGSN